jgi:ubiquinone biosynthesis protein
MYDYQIVVTGSVFLIFRAFAILEGIGKQIHPHFNTYDFIKPYGQKLLGSRLDPKNILNEVTYRVDQLSEFITGLPRDAKEITSKLKKGKIHFEIEHQGYGYLLKKLDSLTNRISLTVLISALIIGSAISMTADWGPEMIRYYGIPYISYWGIIIAGVLFLGLLYSIVRRRRYK